MAQNEEMKKVSTIYMEIISYSPYNRVCFHILYLHIPLA